MRTAKLTGLILMLVVGAGIVFAEAAKADKPEVKVNEQVQQEAQRRPPALNPIGRGAAMPDRQQMYRERIAKLTEAHKASLKELEDIKKIAEEEGATKTAEAIQALIDKKDAEFKEKMQQSEQRRREGALQIQEKLKKDQPAIEKVKEQVIPDDATKK